MAAVYDKTSDPISSIRRAILVSEIPYLTDDVNKLKDKLTIYFGKTRIGGGSVEQVITPFEGSLRKALIIFETSSVVTTVLNRKHTFEGSILKVQELPPIFAEMKGSVETFYRNALPRGTIGNIFTHLLIQFGSGKVEWEKQKLTYTGSIDFLQEVKKMMYVALLKVESTYSVKDMDKLVEKSVKIRDIPYCTDDLEELRETLNVFLQNENHMDAEKIILPIGGNVRKAVVVFKNCTERNQLLSRTQHIMIDEHVVVEELPQVFSSVTASIDQFYPQASSKAKWDKVTGQIQKRFQSKFTKQGVEISGTLDEVLQVAALVLGAVGFPESDATF